MAGAALLVLFAAVGVNFGWQPMTDGTARYEYIVQVEPEVAATLANGKSIPIVSEVPEEIQPVGRVRVVVGKGELPRQRLVTRLKPADTIAATTEAAGGAQEGVELAQYNQYGNQRYGDASANAAPPQTIAGGGTTEWNSGGVDSPITPTAGGPTAGQHGAAGASGGNATTWNNAGQAPPATTGPLGQLGDNVQRAAGERLRQGLEKVDDRLNAAGEKIGSRTRELVDNLSKPFSGSPAGATGQGADRGVAPGADNGGKDFAQWNNTGAGAGAAAGANATGSTNWNNSPAGQQSPATNGEAPRYGQAANGVGAGSSAANASAGREWNNSASNPGGGRDGVAPPPLTSNNKDPFAAAPDPRVQAGAGAGGAGAGKTYPNIADRAEPAYGGAGASWPGMGTPIPELGPTASGAGPQTNTWPGNAAGAEPQDGAPAIRIGMLNTPAGQPLDGTAATPSTSAAGSTQQSQNRTAAGDSAQSQAASWPVSGTAQSTLPNIRGAANDPQAAAAGNQPLPTTGAPKGRDNTALVLAAWVLLTGSVAGNMYLFWSYLDVRQKYRVLVRKTARAVGRYTPA